MNQEMVEVLPKLKYENLDAEAKQKARDWYLEGMDYEWWDSMYEICIEDGYQLGFCIDKIYFSGFYSQGDGACWIGQVDVRQWLETHTQDSIGVSAWCQLIQEDVVGKHLQVTQSGRYSHEETMQFGDVVDRTDDYEDDWLMELPSIFKGMEVQHLFDIIETDPDCSIKSTEALTQAIEESAKDYARTIYKQLREEYEYLCSEEAMLEHFNCNDYHFNNKGELA
jgi:hypothetical protein